MDKKSTPLFEKAHEIAAEAHKGQKDKAGRDYILHPRRVAALAKTEEEKIVGLLHDVVEDGNVTLDFLRKAGYPKEIVEAIDGLTRRQGEELRHYLNRVKENNLATKVKLCDIADNSDPSRLNALPVIQRLYLKKKYRFEKSILLAP